MTPNVLLNPFPIIREKYPLRRQFHERNIKRDSRFALLKYLILKKKQREQLG